MRRAYAGEEGWFAVTKGPVEAGTAAGAGAGAGASVSATAPASISASAPAPIAASASAAASAAATLPNTRQVRNYQWSTNGTSSDANFGPTHGKPPYQSASACLVISGCCRCICRLRASYASPWTLQPWASWTRHRDSCSALAHLRESSKVTPRDKAGAMGEVQGGGFGRKRSQLAASGACVPARVAKTSISPIFGPF